MNISRNGRLLAVATAAAFMLGTFEFAPAAAGTNGLSGKSSGVEQAGSDEVSARKRHRTYRHRRNVAPLHAFGAIAGTVGGIIAAQEARRAYRRHYYDPYYAAPYPGPYYGYRYGHPYW